MAFSIDDAWDSATPVVRAGNAAFGLFCRCGAWSARNSEDGFVPAEVALGMGSPELAQKLVSVGLWEAVSGGFRAVHFLERNESAEQKRARLAADAARKARWRAKAKQREVSTRDTTGDKTRTSRGTRRGSPGLPLPPPKGGRGARERDALTPHAWDDDGSGTCTQCPLPRINKIHPQ